MQVKLTGSWFTPDNRLLKTGIHEVSDDWDLPSNVEVLEEQPAPAAKKAAAK